MGFLDDHKGPILVINYNLRQITTSVWRLDWHKGREIKGGDQDYALVKVVLDHVRLWLAACNF